MKKQKLLQKGKQVFAAVLSASMLMTSVVPETMVYASEECVSSEEIVEEEILDETESVIEEDLTESSVEPEEVTEQVTEEDQETGDAGEAEEQTAGDTGEEQILGDAIEEEEKTVRMDLVDDLNTRIAALPSVDDFQQMSEEDQNAVLEEVNAIADQYYDELTGEEQELVEKKKLDAILEWLSGQVATLSDDVTSIDNGIMKCWRSAYDSLTWNVAGADANTTGAYRDYWGYQVRKSEELENAEITVEPAFKYGGKFVELTYKVTANKAISGGKLSVGAILCTNTEPYHNYCAVKRKGIKESDSDEKYSGFLVTSQYEVQCAQIYFRGKGLSSGDKVATAWMGDYSDDTNYYINFCNNGYAQDGMGERNYVDENMDNAKETAMVLTWNVNLKKEETGEYQLLIGAGYSKDLDAALEGIKVNYSSEALTGFSQGSYEIEVNETTYQFTVSEDSASIPLQGTDSDGTSYNFIGQEILVKSLDSSGAVTESNKLTVPSRSAAPTATAVTGFKFSSANKTITISANQSQEYILIPEETEITSEMWKNAKTLDDQLNSEITFNQDASGKALETGKKYVVYTRKTASDSEKSLASESVKLSGTLNIHDHQWCYKQQGDQITAYCTVDGCQNGESTPLSLSINLYKDSMEYSGEEFYYLNIQDDITSETQAQYREEYFQTTEKGAVSGGDKLKERPVNAGNYYVKVTVTAGESKYSIAKAFTITPKSLTDEDVMVGIVNESYDYDGTQKKTVVTVKIVSAWSYYDRVLTEGTDYELSGDVTASACGRHSITITGTGNYTGSRSIDWKINDTMPPTGKIAVNGKEWDGSNNNDTAIDYIKGTQNVTVTAADGEGQSGVDKIYYVVSSELLGNPADLDNDRWTETAAGGNFEIRPGTVGYIYAKITDKDNNVAYLHTDKIMVYDDATAEGRLTYTKTTKSDATATIALNGNTVKEIKNGEEVLTAGKDYEVKDGSIILAGEYLDSLAAGTHTLTVSYEPITEGINGTDSTITLTVKRASGASAGTEITNASKLEKTYDGQAAPKVTAASNNTSTPKVEYKLKNAADSTYTTQEPVNAGTYEVKVTYPADANYEESSTTAEFTIAQKPVTVEVRVQDKTYDGTTDTTDVEVISIQGTVEGESITQITGLTGTFAGKDVENGQKVTIDSSKAQVTPGNNTELSNYSIQYPHESIGNIVPKELTASVTAENKTYDGKAEATVSAIVTTGVGNETLSITGLTGAFENAQAGESKSVSINSKDAAVAPGENTKVENYRISYPAEATATIRKRPVELTWGKAELLYTGDEQTITATVSNALKNDNLTLSYKNHAATATGTYTAEVTELGNDNYTLTGAENVTKDWSIRYLSADKNALPTPTGTKADGNEWYTGDVTLTPGNGYQISEDGKTWKDVLLIKEDGSHDISYYLKDTNGHITDKQSINIKKDATVPTGEIKIGTYTVTADPDGESGKYFFKDKAEIRLIGTDTASGIAKIEYQKVSSGETFSEGGTWTDITETKTVTMNANDKGVIYARITDIAGNVKIIHSGDIVVYKDVTGNKEASYTRTAGEDMTTDISLNGNTVKTIKYGETVLTEGTDYTVNEKGKIVISSRYLETLPAGEHDLTVSWNPLGEEFTEGAAMADSTIKVSVNRVDPASAETRITNADKLSKIFDGQPSAKVTATSKSTSVPKAEYKLKGAADSTYTTQEPGNAGTYVVRVTYPQNGDYEASIVTAEFTIAQKEIGIQWGTTSFTYNGMTQVPTASAAGLVGADQCTITVEGAQKAVGTYTATAVSVSNPNYCLPQNGTTTSFQIKEVSDKTATGLALNAGLKVTQTGSSIGIKWGKVKGADGYNVYVQYCGSKFTAKSLNQVKSGSKTSLNVKKINGKKLNLKKNYKIYVEAYKNANGEKVVMGRSVTAHIVGRKNSKFTNVKGIKLQKNTFTLKTGKTATIKGTTVKASRYRKQLSDAHAKELRYATNNPSVATVTAKGKIKAVGKGTCTIYVYARNGYTKKVKVTVK